MDVLNILQLVNDIEESLTMNPDSQSFSVSISRNYFSIQASLGIHKKKVKAEELGCHPETGTTGGSRVTI